jgi:hypothetical protein
MVVLPFDLQTQGGPLMPLKSGTAVTFLKAGVAEAMSIKSGKQAVNSEPTGNSSGAILPPAILKGE